MLIEHSETIEKLADALCKAQAVIECAEKDGKNPHFKSDYPSLRSVWDACRKPLTDNGLSIAQFPTIVDGSPGLATMLMHTSGQWMRGVAVLNPTKNDPQGMGSAITYMRRYSLAAVAGVCPADDDGNDASNRKNGAANGHSGEAPPARREAPKQNGTNAKTEFGRVVREWTGFQPEDLPNACRDVFRAIGLDPKDQSEFNLKKAAQWAADMKKGGTSFSDAMKPLREQDAENAAKGRAAA